MHLPPPSPLSTRAPAFGQGSTGYYLRRASRQACVPGVARRPPALQLLLLLSSAPASRPHGSSTPSSASSSSTLTAAAAYARGGDKRADAPACAMHRLSTSLSRAAATSLSAALRGFRVGVGHLGESTGVARRYASAARRPTFSEIAEALEVLGVTIDEDPKSLKKKYRELAKKYHPDAGGEAAMMARVTVSYERLSELTNREREEFKMQKKMFHSGGGGAAAASRRYRPGPAGGFGYAAPSGPFQAHAASNMYGQYYQQDANTAYQQAHGHGQQGFWSQFHNRSGGGGSFSENPFTSSSPFSMHTAAQRARYVPSGTLLLQGLVVYLVLSTMFLFAYRSYRDWRHEDGWRMSESLARHEQMQEMHRLRQEMNERARAMLQRDGGSGMGGDLAATLYGSRQYVGESPEARALEYARQRRIQMMQEQQEAATTLPELRGWPKIEEKGRIVKRAQDPPGVVFFEPRKEYSQRRQIENQRRDNGFVRRTESEAAAPRAAAPADASAPAAATPPASDTAAAAGAGTGVRQVNRTSPLPPETNVSAVVMRPVGGEQEAQAVMRGIFGSLRRSAS